jgi:hypothetical protein
MAVAEVRFKWSQLQRHSSKHLSAVCLGLLLGWVAPFFLPHLLRLLAPSFLSDSDFLSGLRRVVFLAWRLRLPSNKRNNPFQSRQDPTVFGLVLGLFRR